MIWWTELVLSCKRFTHHQEKNMKPVYALFIASVFAVMAGCNTVAGAGKDIERGGEKVQDTARDVQQKL